jgi:SAM-dependent methyltransferase
MTLHPRALATSAFKSVVRLSALGLPCGYHMTRYRMYHDITAAMVPYAQRPQTEPPTILGVGRSLDLCQRLHVPHASIIDGDMPQYDLLDLQSVADSSVDYIVSDQVLEHVHGNPQAAADESWRVLKPGGVAVHTTCLLQELHGGVEPSGHLRDYWRFTPNGLEYLFRRFSTVQKGSWGNRLAFFAFRYFPVPDATWHPLHKIAMMNAADAPIMTWVIAQK